MFEICPKCGNYEWNKRVSVDKWSACCPKCGASWENRAFPLLILTGCSGIGKTTTARRLMERQKDFVVLDGDLLFTDNEGEYMDWVERIEGLTRDIMQCGKPVLWTMAGNLDKLKKAWNQRFFPEIYCLALVCGEEELRRRITEGRGISDAGWISNSVQYNRYFLEHDRLDDIAFERLDITVLDPGQAAERVELWIRSKLALWRKTGREAAKPAGNMSGAKPEGIIGSAGGMLGAGAGGQSEKRAGERSGAPWLSEKSGRKEAGFQPEKMPGAGITPWEDKTAAAGAGQRTGKRESFGGSTAWLAGKNVPDGSAVPWPPEKKAEAFRGTEKEPAAKAAWMAGQSAVPGAGQKQLRTSAEADGAVRMSEQAFPESMPMTQTTACTAEVQKTDTAAAAVPEPEKSAVWIWYYGDFELYHSLKLHARRDEFGHNFPPFWRLSGCRHNVRFRREVELEVPEKITVYARGTGNVEIDGKRRAFGTPVDLTGGKHTILISVLNPEGLPCVYVEGETIVSGGDWLVNDYGREWVRAGSSAAYAGKLDDPQVFKFCYEKLAPSGERKVDGGVLYDFGKETFARLRIYMSAGEADIFYGETEEEALDTEHSYLRAHVRAQVLAPGLTGSSENAVGEQELSEQPQTTPCGLQKFSSHPQEIPARAFRYLYIRAASEEAYRLEVYYEYLPLAVRGSFHCSDELFGRIWDTAAYTFHLNSREFFLDGIKRDRWVWSGDAYQSYLVNRYLFFDRDICKRTILALRGLDPVEKHINTIMDYSFFWLISVYDYYEMSGDREFVQRIFPKIRSLMDFCLSRLDANGFAAQVEDDWIFIDWADMDKTGAVCAEQLLLARSLEAAAECGRVIGEECAVWQNAFEGLRERINRFFWDEEKGAFIDSFSSGKRNVTRHANIFALLFGYADGLQRQKIIDNVLLNDAVLQIRTPYFKLYELEALCRAGRLETVTEKIRTYWGAMLEAGATSFWEEYTPDLPRDEQLGMYGDKYGKSLCHAWGASPVYLAGRYYLGVRPTAPGYRTFEVAPNPGGLDWFEGTVPVGAGNVSVRLKDGFLEVCADADGGVLLWKNVRYRLERGTVKRLPA